MWCFMLIVVPSSPVTSCGRCAKNSVSSGGRTGVCFDNAMRESFWSTLKTEFYDRRTWATRSEAKKAVARWMEIVYNRRRRHCSIGMISPVEFENQIIDPPTKKPAVTPEAT